MTKMDSFRVKLSPPELAELNRQFPISQGSNQIGSRALEIVKKHFRRVYPNCSFIPAANGADLAVAVDGALPKQYEVKGTAGPSIAWQKLKVSSKPSHDLLVSGGASVLRVTNVFGEEPVVFELRCGLDFRLEPEPRWCVKPYGDSARRG